MNHLSKRCGCGAIFTLPNLKSRETRRAACARPSLTFGPAQVQHALTCLFLFAGEMSARGAKRRRDRAFDRANRIFRGVEIKIPARRPTWAEVDAARPVPISGGYFKSPEWETHPDPEALIRSRTRVDERQEKTTRVLMCWAGDKQFGIEYGTHSCRGELYPNQVAAHRREAFRGLCKALDEAGLYGPPAKPTGSHPGSAFSVKVYA